MGKNRFLSAKHLSFIASPPHEEIVGLMSAQVVHAFHEKCWGNAAFAAP